MGIKAVAAAPIDRPRLQVVASRGSIPGNTTNATVLTDGTKTRLECRMKVFFGPQPCGDIRVLLGNFNATGSSAEVDGPNDLTHDLAFEALDASAFAPFKFQGVPLLVNKPGGIVLSDGTPVDVAALGSAWIRSGVLVTNGQFIPISSMFAISGESMPYSTEATSQIMATGAVVNRTTGSTGPGGYPPLAIIGLPKKNYPSAAILGDSLGAGTVGDSSSTVTGARGYIQRGFHREDNSLIWPFVNLSRASERSQWQTGFSSYLRRSVYPYVSYLIDEAITNDVAAGTALATIQGYKLPIWAAARAVGLKVYVVLCLPRTDAGNTTPATGFGPGGIRDQYNAWVLTQLAAGVIDGVINPNTIAEGANNLWANSAWTADGVHLNTTGAPIVAQAVRDVVLRWTL